MNYLFSVFGLEATGSAPTGGAQMGANPASSIILLLAMLAAFYFFIIRPQRKKDKETKQMRDSLTPGDEIITIGGIYGKLVKVSDDTIVLELPHGKQRMTFAKWAIGSVSKKSKDSKDEKVEEIVEDTTIEAAEEIKEEK